ncbi:S41 family peptidase [Chishuiella sp.]|uniref:S41 family peptidase n=1 Tax=Chishuiella sp. TaxID=1969467 RepID=UPI0028A6811B|nr:S41 family peptidase [Chishuiella sp.]
MKNLFKIINVILLIIIIFLIGFLVGKKYDFAFDENKDIVGLQYSNNEQKIRRLVSLIDNEYVNDVNSDSLVDDAINYMVGKLDPHSKYIDKASIQQADEQLKGEFVGIGIKFRVLNDTIIVERTIPGTPNYGKLEFGDQLIAANNESLIGADNAKIEKLLKGKKGSEVNLSVIRDQKPISINVERSIVPIESVTGEHMLTKDIGYIKLVRFSESSALEVHQALENLLDKGMKTLVFDLRGNPGGLMHIAEEIADEFLSKNELIVYTQDKQKRKKYIYATNKGLFEKGKIYVLIDENSASSSEIVTGAIQDYGRGIIVGRRSFGKGLVQREINLGDNTKVRLTVANYFTPSGRSIQKPFDKKTAKYSDDLYQRLKSGELYSKDSIKINKDLEYTAPSGKKVYGGGGIIPDEFVALDTSSLANWLYYNQDASYFNSFLFKKIYSIHDFFMFHNQNIYLKYFGAGIYRNEFLGVLGITPKEFNPEYASTIDNYIKASIAEDLYGSRAFYQVWIPEDEMIKRIFELEKNTK